jgi:hypothetical protein
VIFLPKVLKYKYIIILFLYGLVLLSPTPSLSAEATIDATTSTTLDSHKLSPSLVFISDTTGYMFYRDSGGTCVYSKTTNSGLSWGTAVNTTSQTDCEISAVWYDQWTPGNSGSIIHIIFAESSGDDVYYDTLDTSTDTNGTEAILHSNTFNTFASADNLTITRGTDGDLYAGFCDGSRAANCTVKKCTGTCTTTSNWTAPGTSPIDAQNDAIRLVPLANGNILLVRHDISAEDIQSKVYTDSSNSWTGSWTTIDANAPDSTTYNETLAITLDRSNNDIYLAYGASVAASNAADIRTAVYSGATWILKTDVVTDQNTITTLDIFIDEISKDIYVGYLRGTLTTYMNAYYKVSINGMSTWEAETQFNTTNTDLRQVKFNMMSASRLYGTYLQNDTNDGWFGDTVMTFSAADPSWDTSVVNFKIYDSASLTWGTGTLVCEGTLTDDNSSTINCSNGTDTSHLTTYRVDALVKNIGGTTGKLIGSSEYYEHINVKGGWGGSSPTLGTCAFYDPDTDDGSATCNIVWNATNNVRITNTGTGSVNIKKNNTQGFMYLITTDSDVPSQSTSGYLNISFDTVSEDSSKILINRIPNPPKDPYANNNTAQTGQASPVYKLTDSTPAFSAIFDDTNILNSAVYYQLQVGTDTDWTNAEMWDSTKTAITSCGANERCNDIIYSGTTLADATTYYWRMKFWNNSDKEGVWSPTLQFSMNAYPTVTNVTLNGGSNINLTEATTTPISWTATITDTDGYSDISSVSGKLYRSGVLNANNCTINDNNCYEDITCDLSLCASSSCTATCVSDIKFHAEPTDPGSTYESQYWISWIYVSDYQLYTDDAFSPVDVTDITTLTALSTEESISFGSLFAGEDTEDVNTSTLITNTGNSPIDAELSGTDMCKDFPVCATTSIPVENMQYGLINFIYGDGILLTAEDITIDISLVKPNSSPSTSYTNIYWGIGIPSLIETGDYQGENYIGAITDI